MDSPNLHLNLAETEILLEALGYRERALHNCIETAEIVQQRIETRTLLKKIEAHHEVLVVLK